MNRPVIFATNYIKYKLINRNSNPATIGQYLKKKNEYIPGVPVLSSHKINDEIRKNIETGLPFMAGRFGATELFCVRTFDFELHSKYKKALSQMQMWSGFFPSTEELGAKFKDLMLESISEADVMGIWMLPFEDYYLNRYGQKKIRTTYLLDLEPWSAPDNPWSAALIGKKVLVIHPFTETIERQYKRREKIFPGTDILPEFELKTLKAVQTVAGEKDDRFATWFDALEWMYQEAMKIDFDVAIIGCGAYGFPLAAKLKKAGKQVIHLGGATQILFGIKGKRWEEQEWYDYVRSYFNDSWVRPDDIDKPKQANIVENGCYW